MKELTYEERIAEIYRLGQEEGLSDKMIGDVLGLSRVTIARNRADNNIPTANLQNRRDKSFKCERCKKEVFIRRHERKMWYCPPCGEIKAAERKAEGK